MGTPRNISRPKMKTYIVPSPTAIHVRIYATQFHLDKRGSGRTLSEALKEARHGIPKAHLKKKTRRS
jgi:hypothetical protein